MPSEGPALNNISKYSSLESLQETFKQKLEAILSKELTVENIQIFADEALSEIVELTEEVLKEYSRNPNFKARPTTLGTQEQEDEAFQILGLPNVQEILQSVVNLKNRVDYLKNYFNTYKEKSSEIITPPQDNRTIEITPGTGTFTKKEMLPRLITLLYVLENDFAIAPSELIMVEGRIDKNMMRKAPYVRVEIPALNRAVYVCDEEENASYVLDTSKIKAVGLSLDEIDLDDKRDKNSLIAYYPGIGIRLIQSKKWRDKLSIALSESIPEVHKDLSVEDDERTRELIEGREEDDPGEVFQVAKGELDPWKGFWTDPETGQHWGTRNAIARMLKKSSTIFGNRLENNGLHTFKIKDTAGRVQIGYSFEEFVKLFPELQLKRKAEKKGEWKGFWIDPETGQHWGTIERLKYKFGISVSYTALQRNIKNENLKHIDIEDSTGRKQEAYSLEDILGSERFIDFLTTPHVEESGEWRGFFIESEDRHWGTAAVLASYLGVSNTTISRYVKEMNLTSMNVRGVGGEATEAFLLESFKSNKSFKDFIGYPRVNTEGEWKGFWIDPETGQHWAGKMMLVNKLGLGNVKEFNRLLEENLQRLSVKQIKDLQGKSSQGYSLEEIQKVL